MLSSLYLIFFFNHELLLGSCDSVLHMLFPLDISLHMEVGAITQSLDPSVKLETMSVLIEPTMSMPFEPQFPQLETEELDHASLSASIISV